MPAITLFDTADVYGNRGRSEALLGKALGARRAEVVVATKFGMDMGGANGPDWGVRGSRRYVRRAVEASLRRLGTDWIDLYQMHRPDPQTPIEETLDGARRPGRRGQGPLHRLVQLRRLAGRRRRLDGPEHGLTAFVSAQNEYSWLKRGIEDELVPALEQTGQGLLPFFPLASGLLTGKYRRGEPAPQGSSWPRCRIASQRPTSTPIEALEPFRRRARG